jgi:hypothetical protein
MAHDKTFIFGDYEGYRFPQQTPAQKVVPTADEKRRFQQLQLQVSLG